MLCKNKIKRFNKEERKSSLSLSRCHDCFLEQMLYFRAGKVRRGHHHHRPSDVFYYLNYEYATKKLVSKRTEK